MAQQHQQPLYHQVKKNATLHASKKKKKKKKKKKRYKNKKGENHENGKMTTMKTTMRTFLKLISYMIINNPLKN